MLDLRTVANRYAVYKPDNPVKGCHVYELLAPPLPLHVHDELLGCQKLLVPVHIPPCQLRPPLLHQVHMLALSLGSSPDEVGHVNLAQLCKSLHVELLGVLALLLKILLNEVLLVLR